MAFTLRRDGIPSKKELEVLLEQEQGKAEKQATRLVRQLKRQLQEYERRYERSSQAMLQAVESGQVPETAEVCRWLIRYRILQKLEEATRTVGTA